MTSPGSSKPRSLPRCVCEGKRTDEVQRAVHQYTPDACGREECGRPRRPIHQSARMRIGAITLGYGCGCLSLGAAGLVLFKQGSRPGCVKNDASHPLALRCTVIFFVIGV